MLPCYRNLQPVCVTSHPFIEQVTVLLVNLTEPRAVLRVTFSACFSVLSPQSYNVHSCMCVHTSVCPLVCTVQAMGCPLLPASCNMVSGGYESGACFLELGQPGEGTMGLHYCGAGTSAQCCTVACLVLVLAGFELVMT